MPGHESLETTQVYVGLAKKVQRKMGQEWRCDVYMTRQHTVACGQLRLAHYPTVFWNDAHPNAFPLRRPFSMCGFLG